MKRGVAPEKVVWFPNGVWFLKRGMDFENGRGIYKCVWHLNSGVAPEKAYERGVASEKGRGFQTWAWHMKRGMVSKRGVASEMGCGF